MISPRNFLILLGLLGLATASSGISAAGSGTSTGSKIKKCQDATGKWHYGTTAARECAHSKVIELDQTGIKRKVIAAPPTKEELKRRAATKGERERLAKETERQARRDEILLSTYGHEDDITYIRDRKVMQLESSIKAMEDTVAPLRKALERFQTQAADEKKRGPVSKETAQDIAQSKAQIAKHEAAIATKRKEQDAVRAQYDSDYKRYLELKRNRRAAATVAPKK